MPKTCDFYDCDQPLIPDQPKIGLQFCATHDAEFAALAQSEDIAALLAFWVRAHGGAERMAQDSGGFDE